MTLEQAIAVLEANADFISTKDGVNYINLVNWLKELKERREADSNDYAMNLIRKQWESENE